MILKNQLIATVGLFLLSFIICLDLLITTGEPATFDGPIHITNIAQFYQALNNGDFPVDWANNFSNYGSPIPIVAQQLPNYFGAFLMSIVKNPLVAYKLMMFIGFFISSLFMYMFLNKYVASLSAFTGAALFSFSAYRIINLYIRGAGPELLALIWMPLILLGLDLIFKKHKNGQLITLIGLTGLILTHPLIFVAFQFAVIPFIFLNWHRTKDNQSLVHIGLCYLLALLIGAYYLAPLILEMKYFVIFRKSTQLIPNQFLGLTNFITEAWSYYGISDIFVRKNIINFGIPETLLLISVIPLLLNKKIAHQKPLIIWIAVSSCLLVLLTLPISQLFYMYVPFMDSLQFPWRMLSPLSIFPPLVAAIWIDAINPLTLKRFMAVSLILWVSVLRIPQTYSKNTTLYPTEHYLSTTKNLYFDEMNTLWTGSTDQYPPRATQTEIISGKGTILESKVSNSYRKYRITGSDTLRLVDYTFYFPGWNVYVDGQQVPIEFQDEKYRGIITYNVSAGDHTVDVRFKPTKIRLLGRILSILGFLGAIGYIYFLNANKTISNSKNN